MLTSPCPGLGHAACVLNPQRPPSLWRGVGPFLDGGIGLPWKQPCARYALLRTSASRVQSVSFNICLRAFRGCKAAHLLSGAAPPTPAPHLSQQMTLSGAPLGSRQCHQRESRSASVGQTDYFQVDMLDPWHKFVTCGVEMKGARSHPKW